MAAKKLDKAGDAARQVRDNPYLQRLIDDAELRNNIRTAYESARVAYGRLNNGKAPTRALLEDKKLQKELRNAATALRDAGETLRAPQKRRRRGFGRALLVLVVGGGLAVALSEGLRSKILDALFGAEEEFDYSSTTAPSAPAPETPAPASTT